MTTSRSPSSASRTVHDTIDGGGGSDSITGGAGDDSVTYHGSEANINGGSGTNTLVLASAVVVNLANASDQTSGDSATVTNFANVNASVMTTSLNLVGNSAANLIIGGSGNDTITGGGGADTLIGGSGSDTFSLDASSLALGAKVTGASNGNTLDVTGSATVTDSELASSLTKIQTIDFSGGTSTASLHFSGATVAQIDGSAANTLTVNLNASDSVAVSDPVANYTSSVNGQTTSYVIYDDALHTHVIAHLAVVA